MVAEKLKRGEENGITARDLCKLLDISDTRKLRLLVAQERSEGCSSADEDVMQSLAVSCTDEATS